MSRHYFWIITRDPETKKPFLIKGGASEEEARQRGLEMLGNLDFEVKDLQTTNMAEASARLRGKRLEDGEGLRTSTQRIGHERSLERLKRRRLRL